MPPKPLQLAAALAGAGALLGTGVAIGRRSVRRGGMSKLWPDDIVTLRFRKLDLHRRAPGLYVARADGSSWTLTASPKAARFRVGPATFTAEEWRVVTGMLDAAWALLGAVPADRRIHKVRLFLEELPLESQWSLTLERPLDILRDVSDRSFYVVHERRPSTAVAHLPIWDRDRSLVAPDGVELTRRQWILYTGILEAAWLVGETMDGSIGGGPTGEGNGP